VEWFAAAGFSADHWTAVGSPSASDSEVMAYALAQGHVGVTQDLDFSAILAASRAQSRSVILIRADDLRTEAIGESLLAVLRQLQSELAAGALVTVDADGLACDCCRSALVIEHRPDRLLMRRTGRTFSQYLLEHRLERCRAALAASSAGRRSSTSIAFAWGFNDAAHFSRSFRHRYGLSPRDFRLNPM